MATLHSHCFRMVPCSPPARIPSPLHRFCLPEYPQAQVRKKILRFHCRSSSDNKEEYLLDAHVSIGDGFSFSGGFGFSDKPQPRYGFDYTFDEFVASLESLINALTNKKVTLVVQGYFSPITIKYASNHQEKLNGLILLNPRLTMKHANMPSSLSVLSNFLLGEIFCQDPLRASDKTLLSCGPYQIKEDVAMVYRRPYLTSGSAGFALNVISKAMKKQLKGYVEDTRALLMDNNWSVQTTVCWGQRDRWLSFDGVEDFC